MNKEVPILVQTRVCLTHAARRLPAAFFYIQTENVFIFTLL